MKKNYLLLITLLATLPIISHAQNTRADSTQKMITTAKQVLMRAVGMKSLSFQFDRIPAEKGLDVYEVIALGGKVQVKGSSTIAMTRGAYEYIRKACNLQYTWSNQELKLPRDLPDFTIPKTVAQYKYRQYFNVNTFGYSTAYWHFADWEKELDWMAMHGINMPLTLLGQEAVWQKVFTDMGMTKEELSAYFTGPSFLPWQWLGYISKHNGPLPQSYIDKSSDLQKQILYRMRELGMEPIVPGFAGNVPAAYSRINPDAKLRETQGWNNFPAENKTYFVSPGTAEFTSIEKSFINEYKRFYGEVNYYMVNLIGSNATPQTGANRSEELATYGKDLSDAIAAADADGIWVMQASVFDENESYWDKAAVKSFLSKIPNNKMLIIDHVTNGVTGWNKHEAFYGKPWIFSSVTNYGGNSHFTLNTDLYSINAPAMLASTKKGNVTGIGFSPEGIENNEIIYELASHMAWSAKPISIKSYISDFVKERYGAEDSTLRIAWLMIMNPDNLNKNEDQLNLFQVRPPSSLKVRTNSNTYDLSAELFIKSIDKYSANPNFKNDLALVISEFAGSKVDLLLNRGLELHKLGSAAASKRAFDRAFELMLMMDALMYTLPDQRLERLIENARKYGSNTAEQDYFESDAKLYLTQGGNNNTPELHENASKLWSGLIRDYYAGRWGAYVKALQTGQDIDLNEWETSWILTPGLRSKAPTTGNVTTFAKALYDASIEYVIENTAFVSIIPTYIGNNKAEITLQSGNNLSQISYSTDGTDPWANIKYYTGPFEVTLPATIKAITYKDNALYGQAAQLNLPVSFGKPVSLSIQPAEKYKALGPVSLTDTKKSTGKYDDGNWLGFEGLNVTAQLYLQEKQKISKVIIRVLEDQEHLIFAPSAVVIETSIDGITFKSAGIYDFNISSWPLTSNVLEKTITFPDTDATDIRIQFLNRGICPEKHPSSGKKAWIFIDEITLQ